MSTVRLSEAIDNLPIGRARTRYQALVSGAGNSLAVQVPYHDQPLWFVPDLASARVLVSRGVSRSRIWTLGELREMIGLFGTTVQTLDEAARAFESH